MNTFQRATKLSKEMGISSNKGTVPFHQLFQVLHEIELILDKVQVANTPPNQHSSGARSKFWGVSGSEDRAGVTTVSNSLILGGRVTKVLKNSDEK